MGLANLNYGQTKDNKESRDMQHSDFLGFSKDLQKRNSEWLEKFSLGIKWGKVRVHPEPELPKRVAWDLYQPKPRKT
jgi:hypothetical protein